MTHFELFGVAPAFNFKKDELQRKYIKLQKQYHPDYYGQADAGKQAEAMLLSTQVNQALKILQQEDACIKYVLQLHNFIEEEEKYQLDPGFLMEVMELSEMKLEETDAGALTKQSMALLETIRQPVETLLQSPVGDNFGPAELSLLKAYYYQKKYIDRLLAN